MQKQEVKVGETRVPYSLQNKVIENRKKVLEAFKDLRKKGFIARANFRCCQTCAGYDISNHVEKKIDKDLRYMEKFKGVVYWHRQDEETIEEYGYIYLAYGGLDSEKYNKLGLPTTEAGEIIVETLKSHGLGVRWNGKENNRILVELVTLEELKIEIKEIKEKED